MQRNVGLQFFRRALPRSAVGVFAADEGFQRRHVALIGAVVTDGSVTIVTEKQEITEQDTALVLTLVQVHTGVPASGVRIMTAQ